MTREQFIKKFKVGDRVRLDSFHPEHYLKILSLGREKFFAENSEGEENSWSYDFCFDEDWKMFGDEEILEAPEGYGSPAVITNEFLSAFSNEFFSNKTEVDKRFSCYSSKITWPTTILIHGKEEPLWIKIK